MSAVQAQLIGRNSFKALKSREKESDAKTKWKTFSRRVGNELSSLLDYCVHLTTTESNREIAVLLRLMVLSACR